MFRVLYKEYGQGMAVAGCALMSFTTLSYIMCDTHMLSMKKMKNSYEEKMRNLNIEIDRLKLENNK